MKLRIKGDSLRLRLTQTEVRTLVEAGEVTARMHLAPGVSLAYGLRAAECARLGAAMGGGAITVLVPRGWIDDWAQGDTVGFSGEQDASDGRTLAILVEKDFECLHKRPDEQDAFPNPLADPR